MLYSKNVEQGIKKMANFIFISHCILAQSIMSGVRSQGEGPQQVKPVLRWAMDNDINMCQMPCPEALYEGIKRESHGFKYYNTPEFRTHCRKIARGQGAYIKELINSGHRVLGVVGVVFSPACSTIKDSPSPYHPYGVYMEELEKTTKDSGLTIPFVCVTERWKNKLAEALASLLPTKIEQVQAAPAKTIKRFF